MRGRERSATQTESLDESVVTHGVLALQVIQKLATRIDHANETTPRVMVMLVRLEVVLQLVDVAGEQGTCTSGEPVSPSDKAYSRTISAF